MAKFSEWIKNRGEEEEKKSSSPYSKNDYARYRAEKSIGLDTFESDLANMNTTLSGIVGGWQTQETMANTRSAVESMYKRTTDYQNYISKYQPDAKTNIGDISSYYKNALDSWDSLSEAYGYYKDADSYSKAMKKVELDNKFSGKTYDEVQAEMKKYSPDSDEYKYLSGYTGYSDLKDFDKALASAGDDVKKDIETARNKYALDNKFDLYSDIMKNPDYAEKSQYKSTQNQKKFLGMEYTDYGDETYEFINNVNDARTNLIAKYKEGNGATPLEQHGYEYMTEEEIGVFNYLYGDGSEKEKEQAYKYLEDLEISLNKRSYENSTGKWKEMAGKHDNLAWDALVSLPTLIYQPAGGIGNILASAGEALTGKEYNPYAPLRTPSNASADIRQYVGENMDERYDAVEILGTEAPSLLYQNAMSTLDSLIGVAMFRKGHSVLMASNAFQQTAKQMTEAGENPETALLLGGVSGMAELAFEYAGIDKLFGIKNSDSLRRAIVSALKQAGVEGLEEMGTEFVNILSDTIIRGDHSELMTTIQDLRDRGFSKREINTEVAKKVASQIGLAGLSGMMSGVVMGGTFAGNQYHNLSETGKQIMDNETAGDLMGLAGGLTNKESEAYKLYTEYANKGLNADNISSAKLGNLYNAVEGDVRNEYKTARENDIMRSVANKANEFGDSKNSGLIASAIQKKTDGQRLSSEERTALKSDTAQAIMQDGVRVKASDEFDNALANMKRTESIITPKTEAEKTRLQELKKLKTGEKTTDAEGNEVTIEGVKTENGATTIQTSQGEVLASEMTFSSSDAEIVSYAQNMSAEKADLFVKMYDGKMNVDDYATSFDLAYSYGENKMDLSNALRNKGVLTEAQALKAYEAGNVGRAIAKQKVVDEINKKYAGKTFVKGTFDDSIIDYDGTGKGKVKWSSLTKKQQNAINFMRAVAEVTGANIVLTASDIVDGKHVGENGRYQATDNPKDGTKGNTIYMDVFAGRIDASTMTDAIVPVLSHELTHWMKAKAPVMYQKVQDFILDTLAERGRLTVNQMIAYEKARLMKDHPDQKATDEDAIDELVARGAEDMLANSEKIRELLGNMTESEQKTFITKVKEVFQNIIDWVNELLGKYESNSEEAKLLRQYEGRMKKLSKMWDEALAEAIQTNQSMQAEGITDSAFGMIKSEMQYNLRAVETHKTNLEKQYNAEDADISLGTLMERYDKIIEIWDRLGGEITSEFLNEWNNMVGKDRTFTIFKAQAGYDYNVELSSMCKKGVPLFEAIDHIVKKEVMKELKTDTIGKAEKEILYELLKKHHFEIPCAICYVEQARQREGNLINAFIDGRVEKDKNGKVTYRKVGWNEVLRNIEKEMKANGVDYKFPSVDRNISTENYTPADISMDERTQEAFFNALKKLANEEIKRNNKENNKNRALIKGTSIAELKKTAFKGKLPDNIAIYKTLYYEPSSRFTIDKDLLYSSTTTRNLSMAHREFYSLFNSQGGVGGYKTKQGTVVYWGDILNKKWKPSTLRNAGGVRNQSNSDFQMYTLLDQVQMYIDFSAKGYYLQAYTKVLSELKLLGLSNGKINASLIPKVVVYRNADGTVDIAKTMENAGLDENGNPIFDDIEGINHAEAFMLMEDAEYSKSICGVCIGYSDKHILKLLDDKRIQLIIGFHDKTDDADKRYAGARYAKNYNGINEATKKSDGKTVHFGFNQFVRKAENKFKNGKASIVYDGRTYTANDIPKLATKLYLEYCEEKGYNPAYSQGEVDFSKHENYYKLLADFGLYNSEGNYAPHKKVTYNMPDQVPYLDANGNKAYMPTKDYIKEELKKELKVRDSISEALADKSEEGIIPQFVKEVNKLHEQPKVQNSDRDSDYLDAVNRGDMETAQKMVDEVAKQAGYSVKAYHGTRSKFTTFDKSKIGQNYRGYSVGGFYFTTDRRSADYYSGKWENGNYIESPQNTISAFLNLGNAKESTIDSDYFYNGAEWLDIDPYTRVEEPLETYDSVVVHHKNGDTIVVKNPEQIKSADAVTYDDNGNVIPLSERFNTEDADIRYSDRDSEGNQLTEAQVEFFKDSKVRWGDKLMPVYHGTDFKFTEFKPNNERFASTDASVGFSWASKDKEYAEGYASDGFLMKGYLNITNPLDIGDIDGWRKSSFEELAKLIDVSYDELISMSGKPKNTPIALYEITGTKAFMERVIELGYDGVIAIESGLTTYGFINSNQFKNIDNTNPTFDADIRYSDREQTITSEDTSLNQTPATFTNYEFKSTDRILDWGGGKYDTAKKAMEATYQGIKFEVVDAFNRTKTHNDRILEEYTKEKANVLTINNVLNVINSEAVIESVVSESKQYLAKDGICYIAIYEGSKDGNSKETSAGWQNNQPASWYMQFVEKHYKYVRRQGSFIIASDSPIAGKTSKISTETKATLKQNTDSLKKENLNMKHSAYSDRDNVSVYELMGENESLQKQNAELQADIERLKERLKLEKQITNGNVFDEKKLDAVARHLLSISKSDYSVADMVEGLRDVYSYIVESPQIAWDDLYAKAYDVARNVLAEQREQKVENDYFKMILNDIRKTKIRLSEQQIAEAKHVFGADYHKKFFGRIALSKDGIDLDSKWQEWSSQYPDIFDAEITPADQVTALYDIYDSVKDSAVMFQKYNDEESIRALATEIYNQYWNVSTIRTTADKYDKEIKRLNFEHRNAMKRMRDNFKESIDKQKLADRIHYGKIINDVRNRKEAEIQRAKELGKKRVDAYKEQADRNALIQKITAKSLTLSKWMIDNSKKSHVPDVMKPIVRNFLDAIDFSSKQLLGISGAEEARYTPTKKDLRLEKALSKVHRMMLDSNNGLKSDKGDYLGAFFPEDLVQEIGALVERVEDFIPNTTSGEYVLNQMSVEDLRTLDYLVSVLKNSVTNMNKFFVAKHNEGIADLAMDGMEYRNKLGVGKEYGEKSLMRKIQKTLNWNNVNPFFAFKRYGADGAKIFEAFQDGWDKFAFNVKKIIKKAEEIYTKEEIAEWRKDIKRDIEISGGRKLTMTVPQIMSLYELQKREQARKHIVGEDNKGKGIRIGEIEDGKKIINQTEGTGQLTQNDIDRITGLLTPRQKAVADALQEFMSETGAEWGNEVTMKLYGFKGFGEANYFPIKTDENVRASEAKDNENDIFRLLNMSFTKSINEKANNRIMVLDIFDVFAQHTSDMAKYNALALPVYDAFRWYSFKENTNNNTYSVKTSLETAFGKDGKSYIYTFLKDINGAQNVGRDALGSGFLTKAKLASVGANLKVVLLQPTSYARANAVIDTKYLIQAFGRKPKFELAEEYCGIAQWKSLGFYDTNIQKGVAEIIMHDQTKADKLAEASMKGAGKMDEITIGYLWNACEAEVRDKQKNFKDEKEFYKAVGLRLREVIYSTQVVDSTMTRSQLMRSPDRWDKIATNFMSEPTLSYNMLHDAYMDYALAVRETGSKEKAFKRHGKKVAKTITAYTVTSIVTALLEAGFDAFRDDEEELTADEFLKFFLQNFGDNMSLLGKIPYVSELRSVLQGYTSSRMDTQWAQYAKYTINGVRKLWEGEGNPYTTAKNAIRTFSYASGLPFYNVYRDLVASFDSFGLISAEELEEMFNEVFGDIFPSLKIK